MKPFDLNKALSGEPVVTKDGYKVLDIHYFPGVKTKFPVIAHIENNYSTDSFTVDGKYTEDGISGMDLFMAVTEKYINVYHKSGEAWCGSFCDTLQEAKVRADNVTTGSLITTIRIEL